MKTFRISLYATMIITLCGCTTNAPIVLTEPIGPEPSSESRADGQGQLMVYSALESITLENSDHPAHSSYTIYDQNGKIMRHVDNRTGSFYESPAAVSLPTGTYRVKGRATNAGLVMVPVAIEDGRTTILDLDGSTLPQSKPQRGDQWVRLPDGQVVGAKVN